VADLEGATALLIRRVDCIAALGSCCLKRLLAGESGSDLKQGGFGHEGGVGGAEYVVESDTPIDLTWLKDV